MVQKVTRRSHEFEPWYDYLYLSIYLYILTLKVVLIHQLLKGVAEIKYRKVDEVNLYSAKKC